MGQGPLHRREGEDRPDQRHHPLHPCDGRPDPGDRQGSLRRGSAAVYLDISHPEIEEFLEIRKASGDFNRKGLNLHHGINITDEFMHCARRRIVPSACEAPRTGKVLREIDARQLWQRILEIRLQTGEPYILYIDTVNRAMPKHQRELGLKVDTSNLCSEIMLPTGTDHVGKERTAVCCLSSLNIETWDQWAKPRASSRTCCACSTMC